MAQNGTDMEVEAKQVQVRFTTKLPSALRVATTPFMLPAHLKRYGLSEVVNTLLGLGLCTSLQLEMSRMSCMVPISHFQAKRSVVLVLFLQRLQSLLTF